MASNENKILNSLKIPVIVAGVSYVGGASLNYILGSKTGMHFTFKSFIKNMAIITVAGTIVEYSREINKNVQPK